MNHRKRLRNRILLMVAVLFAMVTIVGMLQGVKLFAQEPAGEQAPAGILAGGGVITPEKASVARFAFIAAAVAFGLGALGAGLAIGNVGAAAMGAVAEKPEVAGQALIFVALAEGLVIFGFITALMILGKV
ncbi:MAG: ATP synthase subunit C [Spirochaetota bacterium]